jgi:plastocyanin
MGMSATTLGKILALGAAVLGASLVMSASENETPLAAGAETGRLKGRVSLSHRLTAHRMRFSLYPDANRAGRGAVSPPSEDEFKNVVVYLERAPDGAAPPGRVQGPVRMEQEGLTFKPHVLAVVKGTTVEFPNRDLLFHNVFSLSKAATFDLGRYPRDGTKSLRFMRPGIVQVFCHIHSDMSGVIVVLDNPFFASPDSEGRFVIDGIPPGEYHVVAWHERARLTTKTIRIEAGQEAVLDFQIPLTDETRGG